MDFDIPNWIALVLELSIAIPFAVYLYDKQRKISKQLEEVIFKQEQLRRLRHDFGIINIRTHLENLKKTLEELIAEFESEKTSEDSITSVKKIWKEFKVYLSRDIENLKSSINVTSDTLDPIESQQVMDVCMKICDPIVSPDVFPEKEPQILYIRHNVEKINNILNYLNNTSRK